MRVPIPRRRHRPCAPFRLLGGLLLAALLAAGAAAQEPATPPDPDAPGLDGGERVAALVERIKYEQARLEAMTADFVQERTSALLLEPETSRGTFAYKAPDRARWEVLEPERTVLVVREDEMLTWYPELGTAERVEVGEQASRVTEYLSASNSLAKLERYFDLRVAFPDDPAVPYRIELEPRFARVEKRVRSMTLWFDRERYVPVRLRWVDPAGDTTEYRFENVEVNPEIPDERFVLDLPPDVEVRTIELGGGGS